MTDKKFKWGLIGPGRIAHQFAQGLAVIKNAALYAVASTNPERGQAFANQYGGAKVYNSYESMVNDPEVDAVYIATPHPFHYENIKLCLEAGKPVLCEKPLTVNAAETRELIELARAKKVFLLEALWTRFLPVYAPVRTWLDQGLIGEIKLMVGTFGFAAPVDESDRWQNPELAGGTLLDMGIYPIAVSQWVMGRQPSSFASMAKLSKTGVDEMTAVLLQYDNGAISQFHSSFLSNNVNDFYIYGAEGYIRLHANFWAATKASMVTNNQEITITRPLRGGGFEYQTEEAMRCIRACLLESPGMPHAETLANMELMDAIRADIGVKYPFEK